MTESEEKTRKEEKRRREELLLLLLLFCRSHADGKDDAAAFGQRMGAALQPAHVEAAKLGRDLAMGHAAIEPSEIIREIGRRCWQADAVFLAAFVEEVRNGRYADAETGMIDVSAMERRAALYAESVLTTANKAFVVFSPDEALWDWVLDHPEQSCEDCPEWAKGSPYTTETLPAVPRDGTSQCSIGCHCRLKRHDGVKDFAL